MTSDHLASPLLPVSIKFMEATLATAVRAPLRFLLGLRIVNGLLGFLDDDRVLRNLQTIDAHIVPQGIPIHPIAALNGVSWLRTGGKCRADKKNCRACRRNQLPHHRLSYPDL
ncbi:hypothetical protein [Tardiphaga sp. 839_C3_N1_4]|uniref:hypothetical protein n=1 Tax=Tardiphaga sp. 839_C3_N1_4 TaxID=3240761 RepID=UPI003F21702D